MRILLIGGTSFISKRFIRKFFEKHELIIYARKKSLNEFKNSTNYKNILFEEGSIEEERIEEIILKYKPQIAIHFAAMTGLKRCQDDPDGAFRTNIYGTFNVANVCAKTNTRIIFLSSREVYGESKNASKEDDTLFPNNVYGITKLLGEQIIQQFHHSNNLVFSILRLTNVYGPEGDNYGAQRIINDAIHKNKITILGGNQRLNFVYVDDVVNLLEDICHNEKSINQIFNVGSYNTLTILEFAKKVKKMMTKKIEFEYLPMRKTETSNFEPDLIKIEEILNFKPKTNLEDGLKNTIKWYS